MADPFKTYLLAVEQNLKAGNATEHTHRPALKALLEALSPGITATNEPKHIACGAPDFIVARSGLTIGYIEAKDVGKSLPDTERSEQLRRYRRSLSNLILTDYLEFRWYVDGEFRQAVQAARSLPGGKLKAEKDGAKALPELLQAFLDREPNPINTPQELAERMARITHMVRDIIVEAYRRDEASSLLAGWRDAFARVLIADLDQPEKTADFADMFAQTLAYGLFSARVMDTTPSFSRQEAQHLIPKSNPFLRDFFYQITGPQMDDEPFAGFVNDLVSLLAHTDMEAVLADFGRRTRQEDPVVHFYETFLAAYDPKLREARGVYYTPEPVVSYIVRSVDHLLKTRFGCPDGLADSSKVAAPNYDPGLKVKGKRDTRKTVESHKVLILDPAAGTGTFLYAVVDHIRQQFMRQGNAGMWAGYVKHHLLPRLFGFELLMAPYAVAHFKLSLQLSGRDLPEAQRGQWGYDFGPNERIGVYLTNTLEEAHEMTGLPLFTQWVAGETNAANEVKRHLPIMVVMGNPPYSNFGMMNKGGWILGLIEEYKKGLAEKKINLDDDFIKFLRFGQWRIERTGAGILAFITNNVYIDGITHRRMRQSLMETFSDIYILNLHGSTRKQERAPDGGEDENVFDIQQGVAIGIFIKEPGKKGLANVHHAEVWGLRESKYRCLAEEEISSTQWTQIEPKPEQFFFVPKDFSLEEEYLSLPSLNQDVFEESNAGIQTKNDSFVYRFTQEEIQTQVRDLSEADSATVMAHYGLSGKGHWSLSAAQQDIRENAGQFVQVHYRPFDKRWTYYTGKTSGLMARPRAPLMKNALWPNILLLTVRNPRRGNVNSFLVADTIVDKDGVSPFDNVTFFPLYLYLIDSGKISQKSLFNTSPWPPGPNGRVPNLNPDFVAEMERRLSLAFFPDGRGDLSATFGPEDVFHYIYAVFHSPTYRDRYAEFLKIDFPRLPLTSDPGLFRTLCSLGWELVGLHLLESPAVHRRITRFPVATDDVVDKGYPKYLAPGQPEPGAGRPLAQGRVYINPSQYFEGVAPEVWRFQVGGYQVLDKWLKDRRGRKLSYDDLTHYQQVVVALAETIRLMAEIDAAIPGWPLG